MEEGQRLLERILDGAEDPTDLPLALLKRITNDFSEENKIGQGGFGAVYKGVFGEKIVAVKRIHINEKTVDDRLFRREFVSLWNTNHRNVIRFLGFCSNTYQKTIQDDESGEIKLANVLERLLCFEYVHNGSLDKHITDELRGLEWETRYEIIIGICKGLCYLHKDKNIIHMDLKPANILLHHQDDKYMVPKITDFGLSRLNENSHTVGTRFGTRGYMAPEYENHGKTSFKYDIYSLGAIIIELVTGCKDVPNKDNVLRRWRHRWSEPPTQLRYQQVTRCMEIAERCRAEKPDARPSILKIISFLYESESTYAPIIPCLDKDDMLSVNPLELLMPCELKNEISHSVELTNDTLNCIAFNIQSPSAGQTAVKGIVPPGCTYVVTVAVHARDVGDKFIVKSMKWTEGLGQEYIIECMSSAEAHKVVDEVDLMVVYEPTKPQINCKRREDTNMPAEEVPEAKKRKIVEPASGKGKNKIGSSKNVEAASMDNLSSLRGQCTTQAEQCNLHTLQSFSRNYPTSTKYLVRESDRAMDHARGAMGSLLDKLGKLITEDYSLDLSIKSDIESFSVQLAIMHRDILKLENINDAKIWVDEVRELSFEIEDMVDCFLVHVEPNSNGSGGFKELKHEGVMLSVDGIATHGQIDYVISYIKDKVQVVADRKKKYNITIKDVANAATKVTIDPWMAIYRNKHQLIGIEAARDALISLLEEDGDVSKKELMIVSIVGMGGSGKTTLAKAVCDKLKSYDPKVFVPVGQNPDVRTILKDIMFEVKEDFNAEKLNVGQLIKKLQEFLKNKRYFIVIDDIWESKAWGVIQSAFPGNEHGSRVITTTRILSVALECCNSESKYVYRIKPLSEKDSKELFFRRIFGSKKDCHVTPRKEEISDYILERCSGMPLAINSIASLLAGGNDSTWEYVLKSLGALSEENGIENMKEILDLSYIHLPDHLKTCLLYVCMYPEDREIDKNELLRKWVAEGFVPVRRNSVFDAEDVAEQYLEELINMSMIQPEKIDYNNEVLSCRVHDIIVDLMRSKSSQVNFIQVIDGSKDVSGPRGKIRRVSVQYNDKEDGRIPERIIGSLSHARSVILYRASLIPNFLEYKYVRVLHIEDDAYYKDLDLTGISSLFWLRYLKIACTIDLKRPVQIGQLRQLETIDLEVPKLKDYLSDIVTLPRLLHLRYGELLPYGIERLKSLHTLECVGVDESSVETIKGLGELTNLRNLSIYYTTGKSKELESACLDTLHSSISRLSTSLRILTLSKVHALSSCSRPLFPPGSHIQKLDLSDYTFFERCPKWIGQLHYLYSLSIAVNELADGFSIVGGLPSLAYFYLYVNNSNKEKEENVVISGSGAFQALKHLIVDSRMTSLTYEEGTMPKLEKLKISFPYKFICRLAYKRIGIEHLPAPTLKKISLTVTAMLDDWKVKGSEHWNNRHWEKYRDSDHYRHKIKERGRKTATLLRRAFKSHHPSADIYIVVVGCYYSDSEDVDKKHYEEGGDEEHDEDAYDDEDYKAEGYYSEEDKEGTVQANTRQLVQLIEAQEDSGRMSINTDVPMIVDTSLHLAVVSAGRKSGPTKDLETLQLPFTSLLAPSSPSSLDLTLALAPPRHGSPSPPSCSPPGRAETMANFPVDVNMDFAVQQGNNGMLVNAVAQDLNHDFPPGGLVDLNQAHNQHNGGNCYYIEDDEAASQVNGSQPSAQVQAHTRQLVQLIEEEKYSGRMGIETDAPPIVDTSLHLAVGSEERQSGCTEDLESCSWPDRVPQGGVVDLNQAPPNEATRSRSSS